VTVLACVAAAVVSGCSPTGEIDQAPPAVESTSPVEPPQPGPDTPVVLISIDTLRSDRLPIYGYDAVDTPAIDAMRARSILFERAYSHSPMTLPAHVSMLTGTLPGTHGVRNNIGYAFDPGDGFHLPCALRTHGYATGAAVSTYVLRGESGFDACFDHYDDAVDPRAGDRNALQERSGRITLDRSKAWIQAHKDEPFFFLFHIYEPHAPYDPPEPYRNRYSHPYDGEVAAADAIVGGLIEFLEERGIWDRALVILTSDHGEGLGDHGEMQHSVLLNRELIQVPLLVKLPEANRAGDTVTEAVQLVDLAPTILDVLGFEIPGDLDGVSLIAGGLDPDRPVFAETLFPRIHMGWSELSSLIRGRFHFIESPDPELYDLVADPAEKTNLVESSPETAAAMRRAIEPFVVPMQALGEVDPEAASRLAALGYVGEAKDRTGPLPDPKTRIGDIETIRQALQLSRAGRSADARNLLRGLVDRNPNMVEGWTTLGDVLDAAGDHDGGADAYRRALNASPIAPAHLMLDAAEAALWSHRLDEAESLARAAVDGVPSRGHEVLARVAMARGDLAEAEREARAATGNPPRPAGLVLLADTIQAQGRFAEALATLDQADAAAVENRTDPVFGLSALRGETLGKMGNLDGAKTAYRQEIDAFPSNLEAWTGLCVLHAMERDRQTVYRLLEEMADANPGPRAADLAANTLEAFGDASGATHWRRLAVQ
jgi:arylsulfatase A-like enzyme/tetratricopeptide (TPR) repeat protein